jgi:hypothetical protein
MMMLLRRLHITFLWMILLKFGLHHTIHYLINPSLITSNTEVLIIFLICYAITVRFGTFFQVFRWNIFLFTFLEHLLIEQMCDILYYEILDIPLPELESLKTLRVAFHNATNNEVMYPSGACKWLYFLTMS